MEKFEKKPDKPFDPFHPEESRGREELRKYHGCDSFGACLDDCRQCLFWTLNQETNPEERDDEQFEVF